MGIIARVRVSLTIVADSKCGLVKTVPGTGSMICRRSSLTAVPARGKTFIG